MNEWIIGIIGPYCGLWWSAIYEYNVLSFLEKFATSLPTSKEWEAWLIWMRPKTWIPLGCIWHFAPPELYVAFHSDFHNDNAQTNATARFFGLGGTPSFAFLLPSDQFNSVILSDANAKVFQKVASFVRRVFDINHIFNRTNDLIDQLIIVGLWSIWVFCWPLGRCRTWLPSRRHLTSSHCIVFIFDADCCIRARRGVPHIRPTRLFIFH